MCPFLCFWGGVSLTRGFAWINAVCVFCPAAVGICSATADGVRPSVPDVLDAPPAHVESRLAITRPARRSAPFYGPQFS